MIFIFLNRHSLLYQPFFSFDLDFCLFHSISIAPKASVCNTGDLGSIPGLGRSPGGGHGNPHQYSCLENPHGQRRLAGCSPWGSQRVRPDWATQHSTAQKPALIRWLFEQRSEGCRKHCRHLRTPGKGNSKYKDHGGKKRLFFYNTFYFYLFSGLFLITCI